MIALESEIESYLYYSQYQKELDLKTIKAYRIDLRQFTEFLQEKNLSTDKDGINAYLYEIHRIYKQRTVKRKIASIKAFLNYLEYEEKIEVNPFNKIRTRFKEELVLPRTIPKHTVECFLKKMYQGRADQTSDRSRRFLQRDIAVVELLFATGLRVSELCNLRKQNIDIQNGIIRIMGKGGKERYMQIGNQEVISAVWAYFKLFQETIEANPYFFVNKDGKRLSEQTVRGILNKHANNAQIELHITPHMFRHAFATLLLEEDVDIRYIQKMLGHASIVTTQIYTSVASEKQKEILQTKHPRNKMQII